MNLENSSSVYENDGDTNLSKCKQVKACIDAYLLKNPNLTLVNVEDKTSVPHSTLRRIMNLKGNLQPEAVIKIYRALGFDQDLFKYMKEFHPDIASVMSMKSTHNREYDFIKDEDREFFTSEDYYLIINLAYSTSGTSIEEVTYHMGQIGTQRLEDLLKKGLIVKNENDRFVGKYGDYQLGFADTKKGVEMALKYYRLEESGGINNWLSFQTESLNAEGLKALKILQQKHFNERKEQIFNNSMYSGNLKAYSATVSSTFLAYSDDGGLQ